MQTFKRLSQSKVLLDNIIWETNQEKAVNVRSAETGFLQHSIKIDGVYYYPVGVKGKKADTFELETISQ